MKKNTTKIFIAAVFLTISGTAFAQEGRVGINTSTPAATLDVVASPSISTRIDGLIAPRLKGSELKSKDNLYTADQDGAIVYVTEAVSGVTDKTTNVTSIGYYYFDKTVGTAGRWMKIANPTAVGAYKEPWNQAGTSTPADANNQAIYQSGAVSIWRNKVFESTASGSAKVDLHVNGATRVGATDPNVSKKVGASSFAGGNAAVASGNNAMAYGTSVEASGDSSSAFGNATGAIGSNSIAMGNQSTAVGENSAAFGFKTTSSAINSLSIGANTTAMGAQSVAGGSNSTASGQNSLAMGNNTKATAFASASFGELSEANSTYSLSAGYYNQTQNPGEAAFGVYNMTTSGALFTVGDGAGSGASNVTRSNIISAQKASNGNFVAVGSGTAAPSKVQDETLRVYGGALANKAYVTDINSVTGATTDKVVVADGTTGQLKTISATGASVSYKEPWNIQNSSTPSASNNDAIYQTGNVAIGRSIGYTNGGKVVSLDVKGEIRTGAGHGGAIGINSVAMGLYNEASGDASFAAGISNKSVGNNSFAVGNTNTSNGNTSTSFGSSNTNNGDNAVVMGSSNTVNAGSTNSFTGGGSNTMSGNYAFTMGQQNKVSGTNSGAFGLGNTSSGERSISIGYYNTASGSSSFSGGSNSVASGDSSVAFGVTSKATNGAATAFGEFNEANGYSSAALGRGSIANGKYSVAVGVGAKTSSIMQSALGSFNYVLSHNEDAGTNPTNYLFMVGDGYADTSRSNIIVAQTGNGWSSGNLANNFVAIGSGTNIPSRVASEKLRVYGGVNATSYAVGSTTLTVPDYVFQKYYTGTSTLKNDYNFMSNLYDVEKFLKENHHLPGITSAKEIQKKGYYKIEDMQMQNLEKTEELYLHTIEQQKQIDELKDIVKQQQKQIDQLLKK